MGLADSQGWNFSISKEPGLCVLTEKWVAPASQVFPCPQRFLSFFFNPEISQLGSACL